MWGVGIASERKMRVEASELVGDILSAELIISLTKMMARLSKMPHVCTSQSCGGGSMICWIRIVTTAEGIK